VKNLSWKKYSSFWILSVFSKNRKISEFQKLLKKPKFTNFQFLGWEKIEFIHSIPKFFTDHESAFRIFKNESKIWENVDLRFKIDDSNPAENRFENHSRTELNFENYVHRFVISKVCSTTRFFSFPVYGGKFLKH
jgi:hypothetical protein